MAMRNMSVVGVWGTFVRQGVPNAEWGEQFRADTTMAMRKCSLVVVWETLVRQGVPNANGKNNLQQTPQWQCET